MKSIMNENMTILQENILAMLLGNPTAGVYSMYVVTPQVEHER